VTALTAPYWVHFLRSLPWYAGRKGWTAWMIDPIVLPCALAGLVAAVRRPTQNAFRLAWAAAPISDVRAVGWRFRSTGDRRATLLDWASPATRLPARPTSRSR
jgi:hypothetical protein